MTYLRPEDEEIMPDEIRYLTRIVSDANDTMTTAQTLTLSR
jgi:hypothetical protein